MVSYFTPAQYAGSSKSQGRVSNYYKQMQNITHILPHMTH